VTNVALGTARAEIDFSASINHLNVAGRDTGAFLPDTRTWRWPSTLSGELDEAPIVVMDVATSVAATAAILNASVDPRGLDATVVFDYGTAVDTSGEPVFGHTTTQLSVPAGYGPQPASIPITGLTADTQYYARARAANNVGETPSGFVAFRTSVDAPSSGPPIVFTGIALVGVPTQTAVTLTAAFDMNNAAGQIHIERFNGTIWVDVIAPQAAPSGVQTMTATASGLTAGTTYQFRARATNPNAPEPGGTTSGPISVTTASAAPVLPVATLLPPGTPTLTTEVVNARISQVTEVPVRYQFQYGLTTGYGSTTPLVIDSALPPGGTEDVAASITGLTPATTYHYRLVVMRIDAAGGNQFSSDGTFTTATPPDPTLPVPTITTPGTLTSTSAVVNGRVDNIAEVPAKYQFEYGLTTAYGSTTSLQTDSVIPAGGGEAVAATITGLAASTTYHYRLNASRTDDAGGFQHSADGTFTTASAAAAILPATSPLGPVTVGQTTALVSGTLAQITSQSNVNYHFEYGTTTSYGTSTSVFTATPQGGAAATRTSALVAGSVDPKGATLTLSIDYGTDPDNLNQNVQYGQISGTGAKAFSMLVDGLSPNAIYWFRARATNSGGTSVSTMRPTRMRTYNPTPGTTVHISPTGNNSTGDGSAALPWKTIQKAVSTPGVSTVLMHVGQYAGQTITARPSSLVTIMDAGDGVVELDFVTITAPAGNLNFEGNIKATGYSRPDLQSTLIFQGTGDGSGAKAGPVYWAAGNITAIGKTSAAVCIRASADADNFYFDGIQTQGGGFGVKGFTGVTPTTSYPTGWRFTGCNFGPDHTWDCVHIGSGKNWRFIACDEHDPKSLGGYVFGNTSEEHHDATQMQYGDDIKWIGGRVYDRTNIVATSPGSAILFNADTGGAVVSNMMYIGRVIESWRGGGINITNGTNLKLLQTTIGTVTGNGDGTHPASTGSTSDFNVDGAATSNITIRGVNAREQFVSVATPAFTVNDKNFWRSSSSRAGTNAKSGTVTFVSSTDLHLSDGAQAAATGGPLPTEDPDVLAWDNEGRGYGANPAIGAYASPTVTSPLFTGMVTATPQVPESSRVTANLGSLTAATLYHYRFTAIRSDGSGGTQNSTDAVFTTQNASLVTTPAVYGPATAVSPGSTVAGGTFVVKSDGKIYDSTGTTLQDFTSKAFNTLVTIKSDTAGTRRSLNAGLLNNSQYQAGLVLTELTFNDPTGNLEIKDPTTTFGVRAQGIAGRFGHMRFVNATHGGIVFEKSAANVPCGATGSTWNTASPDLRIDNVTAHGSSPDGLLISVTGGRNVVLGGWDVGGHNSAPTGLGGTTTLPSVKFDGASADDVQDCRLGIALDGTPSIIDGSAGSYRIWLGNCRRCGWEGQPNNPVLFANTLGSRPEKCAWLAVSGGGVPGSETAVNTTPALVTTDNPCMRDGQAQNLVTYTFRNGATGLQAFEVDATVWDPAVSLAMWSSTLEQATAVRFIDPKNGLGARPTSAVRPALTNKTTITNSWTIPGGAGGSVARAGDGWFEVRGVRFDPGTAASPIWSDGAGSGAKLFVTDNSKGAQLIVASAAAQPGGVMPVIPPYTVSTPGTPPTGGATLKVTKPDGTAADFTGWPTTPSTTSNVKTDEHLLGIYTNFIDPLLGANAVESGVGYRRQLGYTGINAAAGTFTGVFLIQGPSGGAINPDPGDILTVSAATPGVVTTFFPHGLATNDWVSIAGNTQAAANGTFKATRITATTFSLQTTAGVNVAIPTAGSGGTYTPLGPGGTGYTYGLTGTVSSLDASHPLTAGTTLDMTQNDNLGQPGHNVQLLVGADTGGNGIRFIGCDFHDVSVQAIDTTIRTQLVDCQHFASSLPGTGIDHDTVDNAVRGTYDPSNQYSFAHMIGGLNMVAPGEAFWIIERCLFTNAHGDIMPGRYQPGSVLRHSRLHHARDGNNTSITGSVQRDTVPPFSGFPKVAQGPHGDQFQNYDRYNIAVVGCDLHSNGNNSIAFTQNLLNYAVFTGVPFTNSGGHYLATKSGHGFNVGDFCRIDSTGDATLDGFEFVVTAKTNTTFTLGTTTFVANRTGTATHVVHQTFDFRRTDMRVTRSFNRSSLTEDTSLTGLGNKTFSNSNAQVPNLVTMNLTFLDNRWDTGEPGGSSGWVVPLLVAGSLYNYGTPNRNLWRNYEATQGFVPGGVANPKN
jgi:phosphodiesterase/alkaline phosphatase D-like protein